MAGAWGHGGARLWANSWLDALNFDASPPSGRAKEINILVRERRRERGAETPGLVEKAGEGGERVEINHIFRGFWIYRKIASRIERVPVHAPPVSFSINTVRTASHQSQAAVLRSVHRHGFREPQCSRDGPVLSRGVPLGGACVSRRLPVALTASRTFPVFADLDHVSSPGRPFCRTSLSWALSALSLSIRRRL